MIQSLRASVLIMGLGGIIAQIILLRELPVSFFGNELTLGIILANWLILEAIGSFYVGRSVEKTERKLEIFVLLQLIFSLAFPFAYVLFTSISHVMHQSSIQSQWKQMDVIHNENSIYGNINVTKRGEQFTFFTDGVPSITAPVPDIASIEDFAE